MSEKTVLIDDEDKRRPQQKDEQTNQHIQRVARKRRVGRQVSPDCIDNQRRWDQMGPKEYFIGESAKEGKGTEKDE